MDNRCVVLVIKLANIVGEMHKMSSIMVVGGGFLVIVREIKG
jgi:hypothetical protein